MCRNITTLRGVGAARQLLHRLVLDEIAEVAAMCRNITTLRGSAPPANFCTASSSTR